MGMISGNVSAGCKRNPDNFVPDPAEHRSNARFDQIFGAIGIDICWRGNMVDWNLWR
jgi:hypothetical protein